MPVTAIQKELDDSLDKPIPGHINTNISPHNQQASPDDCHKITQNLVSDSPPLED